MLIKIQRLPTRDLREDLTTVRKKLWIIVLPFLNKKFVLFKVSKDYSKIYFKHYKASRITKKAGICSPKHLIKLPFFKISLISWCGNNIANNFSRNSGSKQEKLIFQVFNWLKKFNKNESNGLTKDNKLEFRYINLLMGRSHSIKLTTDTKDKLISAIKRTKSQKIGVGPGIEDPVLSNFTRLGKSICLVDLDNLSPKINFYYEAGFLLADLEIDHGLTRSQTKSIWENYLVNKGLNREFNQNLFIIGHISRYAITALNIADNKKENHKSAIQGVKDIINRDLKRL